MNSTSSKALAKAIGSEFELLHCCARTDLDAATIERVKQLLKTNINFADLLTLAGQHRVKPLLYHSLVKYFPKLLDHPEFKQLQQQCRRTSLHNMYLMQELLDVAEELEKHGIQAISFKGPILANIYGDLSLRQIKDLDFIVLESDFQKTVEILVSKGYKLMFQMPWETHLASPVKRLTGTHSIDLHRDIVPKHLSCFNDSSELWNYIKPCSFLGRKAYTFTPDILLFILCLNGTKEGWFRLNRICDVAELVRAHPTMDWQHIVAMATQLGIRRLLFLGLFLAHDLLGTTLPAEILDKIHADSAVQVLAVKVKTKLESCSPTVEPKEIERSLFHIRTRERWSDKIHSLLGLLSHSGWMTVTKNDRQFLALPPQLSFLYVFIRPIRILMTYSKVALASRSGITASSTGNKYRDR